MGVGGFRFVSRRHVVFMLSALWLSSSAFAQNYFIMNLNSGRVLDVTGGGSSQAYQNGTAIQQWDWLGGANQQWQIIPIGNGYNEIVNVQSGKVLDVRDVSVNPFAVIQQWDWLGGANQQWQLVDLGDGSYKILNLNSSLVLDVNQAQVQNGAAIVQLWDQTSTMYTPSHTQPQPSIQWILIPVDASGNASMPTEASNDGDYYSDFAGRGCGGTTPNFLGYIHTWVCGSQVMIHWEGFTKSAPLQKAIDNWNNQLRAKFGYAPVSLLRETGGPEGIHVYRVDNTAVPCTVPSPSCHGRAQNTNFQTWIPPSSNPPGQTRLRFLDIQMIQGMTYGATLTNTFAHELGHTFGLDDCSKCGQNTVMDTDEPSPKPGDNYINWNFTEGTAGPTNCDTSAIQMYVSDYSACNQVAEAAEPQSCQSGATEGFADVGPSGEYTCNGAVCDGCNGACNNFAGNGCSGTPDPGCSSYCGDVCMDGAYCPDMYLGGNYYPSCDASGNVYCPSDTNYSPILLDVLGEGFHLTSVENGVPFTLNLGRDPMQVSWTDPNFHNGWLVLDRNGNGTIDDLSEMFGNLTKQPQSQTPNGYLALAAYDDPQNGGNGNGLIDPGDQIFAKLQIWIDQNHNGVSETQELRSLASFGITSISLRYSEAPTTDAFGNAFRYQSTVTATNKTVGQTSYDVYLQVQRPH